MKVFLMQISNNMVQLSGNDWQDLNFGLQNPIFSSPKKIWGRYIIGGVTVQSASSNQNNTFAKEAFSENSKNTSNGAKNSPKVLLMSKPVI